MLIDLLVMKQNYQHQQWSKRKAETALSKERGSAFLLRDSQLTLSLKSSLGSNVRTNTYL